jgi:uncharacterized membrane protein
MRSMHRPSPCRAWLARALVVLVVLFSSVGVALAQRSGGSFGGGDFGGGGGGGYEGGGGYHDGGGHGGAGLAFALIDLGIRHPPLGIAMVAMLLLVVYLRSIGNAGRGRLPGPQARAWMNVDVTAVRIAIDARSREFVQRELAKIAGRGSSQSRQLLESLQRTIRLLRKCDAAWVYGGASNYHPMSPPVAEGVFRRHAQDARSKFSVELVRNAESTKGPGYAPKESEGEGVALITLVVAARREIRDFFGGRRDEINAVLEDLERLTPHELVALEVVWMPADPEDRMSSATLETLERDIAKLPPLAGKGGKPMGRVHCAYCRGPFAAELPTCPHCGAPAPGESASESPSES